MGAEEMFESKQIKCDYNPLPITKCYQVGKVMGLGNLGEVRKCKTIEHP